MTSNINNSAREKEIIDNSEIKLDIDEDCFNESMLSLNQLKDDYERFVLRDDKLFTNRKLEVYKSILEYIVILKQRHSSFIKGAGAKQYKDKPL